MPISAITTSSSISVNAPALRFACAIDKYFGDVGAYPESLEELVEKSYLRKIPLDPYTERADSWVIVAPGKQAAGKVFDVRSGATGKARDGSDFASW